MGRIDPKSVSNVVAAVLVLFTIVITILGSINWQRQPYFVSIVDVLANPKKHMGAEVIASGYLDLNNGLFLYLTREHYEMWDELSALAVTWPDREFAYSEDKPCIGLYVQVTGTLGRFRRSPYIWLKDIQAISLPKLQGQCWTKTDGQEIDR